MKRLLLIFLFLMISQLHPVEAKDYLSLIEQAFIGNNWEEVIEIGKEWQEIEPKNTFAHYFISHAYFASYHPDEGYDCKSKPEREAPGVEKLLPVAEKMTGRYPDNSHLYIILANTYMQTEKFKKAIKMLKKSIKLNPGYGGTYFALGSVYELKEKERKAASVYKKGIKRDTDFLPNYERLGLYYYSHGRKEKGEEILKAGLERNTEHIYMTRLNASLGRIYLKDNKYDKAISILRAGLELKPKDRALNWALGDAYTESGRFDKAGKLYRELLNADWACCKSLIRGRLSDLVMMQREEKASR